MTEYVYYKKNVNFNVAVRFHMRDNEGIVLTGANPYVNVDKNKIKDFMQANRAAIQNGTIKEADEPVFDFLVDNTLTDEEAAKVVKNVFVLKKKLNLITSETTLLKLHSEATKQKRPKSILTLIEDRIEMVNPTLLQGGVTWDEETGESGGE